MAENSSSGAAMRITDIHFIRGIGTVLNKARKSNHLPTLTYMHSCIRPPRTVSHGGTCAFAQKTLVQHPGPVSSASRVGNSGHARGVQPEAGTWLLGRMVLSTHPTRARVPNYHSHVDRACVGINEPPHTHTQVALLQLLRHKYPLLAFPRVTDGADADLYRRKGASSTDSPADVQIPTLVRYRDHGEEVDLHVIFMLSALGCAQVVCRVLYMDVHLSFCNMFPAVSAFVRALIEELDAQANPHIHPPVLL